MARKNTKEVIVDAAMQLFWENSYESVGTDLICKAANIKKGSLYHYFPSKEELALAAVNERWIIFEDQILKLAFDKSTPPLKRFYKFSDVLSKTACKIKDNSGDVYGCPFGNFASELSTQKKAIRSRITSIFDKYTSYFEKSLQDAIQRGELPIDFDTKNTAKLMFSAVQGCILVAKAKNDPYDLKANFDNIFKVFLKN